MGNGNGDDADMNDVLDDVGLEALRANSMLSRDEPHIVPLPGEGAADAKYNRLAAEEFRFAQERKDIDAALHASRGTGFAIFQVGERLAYQARDAADLGRLVRQQFGSHLLENDTDAQKLADAAFTAFAKRQRSNDTDYAWMMSQAIAKEYRGLVAGRRRREVAARARAIEKDPIFRDQVAWREKVQALADEFGLEYQVVEAILIEYSQATMTRHPGVIDPRRVPFLQVQAPLVGIAKIINFMTGGAAGSFASFVTGLDMDGNQLSAAERFLEGVLAVMSIASPGGGNIISDIAQIGKLGFTSIKAILLATRGLARAAATSGVGIRDFLRLLSHLRRIDPKKVAALLKRVKEARAARKTLRLTDGEASLMREIANDFREHSLPTARVAKIAKPTARAFMFLNRRQPLVLDRLLGKPWATAAQQMRRPALQEAEDVAASIRARIRQHWDAALPRGQRSAMGACQSLYDRLRAALARNPGLNANDYVRRGLYNEWRKRAMKNIGNDAKLVRDLKDEAGIIVGQNPLTRNWTIHIRTKGPNAKRVQTHVDFDHAVVGHETAVADTLRFKDARPLISTIDGGNLQLMTARENRNFIEVLRRIADEANAIP